MVHSCLKKRNEVKKKRCRNFFDDEKTNEIEMEEFHATKIYVTCLGFYFKINYYNNMVVQYSSGVSPKENGTDLMTKTQFFHVFPLDQKEHNAGIVLKEFHPK